MEEGRPAAAITDQEALASALERTTDAAGAGAITGVAGGLAARGAAARPSGPAEALKPATRVSPVAKMKAEAQQLERAYRRGKGLPETLTGKGFMSPEAQTLWKRASGLEKLEQIVRTSKGDAGVIRRQLDALSRNRREFGRFTEEQQAAIHKIIEGGNAGRVLEELGFFKFGAKALARTTGRAIDRRATGRGMTDLMRGME